MIRPLELFIGLRYLRARRRNHFISFISVMAGLGIVLGVTALITVLSVMNGFGQELRDRILGAVSHVTVHAAHGPLRDWQAVNEKISRLPHVRATAPYVEGEGMISLAGNSQPTVVRGIDPQRTERVSTFRNHMREGSLDDLRPGRFGVVLGSELAWRLGAGVGSRINLLSSRVQVTPAGLLPRSKTLTVVGIFQLGISEYDGGLALMNLDDASRIFFSHGVTGIRLDLDDLFAAPAVSRDIDRILGKKYRAIDWTEQHASFFRALRLEKIAMFVIMMLVVAVAAFNIVSMLIMMVTEKEGDIAILRTLGLSPRSIMGIFMINGGILGIGGTLAGVLGGVLLADNIQAVVQFFEDLFGAQLFSQDIYYYTGLVGDIHWPDVIVIAIASLVVTVLATVYPARRASLVQPSEALRYE
ncbi:MAG: lipoprotein-releasing ABC transporter permease subunit [Acidiferrobacteraceae bacterium]